MASKTRKNISIISVIFLCAHSDNRLIELDEAFPGKKNNGKTTAQVAEGSGQTSKGRFVRFASWMPLSISQGR